MRSDAEGLEITDSLSPERHFPSGAVATSAATPTGFGTVGCYFGTFGHRAGLKATVDLLEVEADV